MERKNQPEARTIRFSSHGGSEEIPLILGSQGEAAMDLSPFCQHTGVLVYDPGYQNTASCQSSITYVDGEKGVLRYRGYPVEELVTKTRFLDVAQLLINGDFPTEEASLSFHSSILEHSLEPGQWINFFKAVPQNAPPMAILSSAINMMSMYFPKYFVDDGDPATLAVMTAKLVSAMRTITAFSYKQSKGEPFVFPQEDNDYVSVFLRMMFSWQGLPYEVDPTSKELLETLLIVHADHEQNCSTATVRLVGSSRVNLYSSICAGICALWGPLHGGANQKVIEMLEEISTQGTPIAEVLSRAKQKTHATRLMGVGHRIYRTSDPRAKILKELCHSHLARLRPNDPLLDVALELEHAVLDDPYFQDRHLYPNVDFYSGLLYRAIGIPTNMFTVMFAMGRLPGWIAHWKEMHQTVPFKIGRPRQLYIGPTLRHRDALS